MRVCYCVFILFWSTTPTVASNSHYSPSKTLTITDFWRVCVCLLSHTTFLFSSYDFSNITTLYSNSWRATVPNAPSSIWFFFILIRCSSFILQKRLIPSCSTPSPFFLPGYGCITKNAIDCVCCRGGCLNKKENCIPAVSEHSDRSIAHQSPVVYHYAVIDFHLLRELLALFVGSHCFSFCWSFILSAPSWQVHDVLVKNSVLNYFILFTKNMHAPLRPTTRLGSFSSGKRWCICANAVDISIAPPLVFHLSLALSYAFRSYVLPFSAGTEL